MNAEESNIKFISEENQFLDQLIGKLRFDYKFPVDNAAIYYIFDRDAHSNADPCFIRSLISKLRHSRGDNEDFITSGLLLLSYPAVESFTLSNFCTDEHEKWFATGAQLKQYNNQCKINHQKINEATLLRAVNVMKTALKELSIEVIDIDNFYDANMDVFDIQESHFKKRALFRALSCICVALLDLNLIEDN